MYFLQALFILFNFIIIFLMFLFLHLSSLFFFVLLSLYFCFDPFLSFISFCFLTVASYLLMCFTFFPFVHSFLLLLSFPVFSRQSVLPGLAFVVLQNEWLFCNTKSFPTPVTVGFQSLGLGVMHRFYAKPKSERNRNARTWNLDPVVCSARGSPVFGTLVFSILQMKAIPLCLTCFDWVAPSAKEDVGPCVVGFPVSTVAEPVTVRVKDASSVVNAVPDIPRRTNCGRCAQCCVSVQPCWRFLMGLSESWADNTESI